MMNGRKERIAEIRMADWERQLKTRSGRLTPALDSPKQGVFGATEAFVTRFIDATF